MTVSKGTGILREVNKRKLLSLVRRYKQTSRKDLVAQMGVSKNTVSLIVEELMIAGLIEEVGINGQSSKGRPKITLQLAESAYQSIGVLVNDDHIQVTVMHYNGDILENQKIDCSCQHIEQTKDTIVSVIKDIQGRYSNIVGVGIAIPGIVNCDQSIVYESARLGWRNELFDLNKEYGLAIPVRIQNRVRMNALQSIEQDVATSEKSIFFLQVSEGVGGAFIDHHQILSGGSWTAGEIGHISVKDNGPLCTCGQNGCLEVLISELAFAKRIQETRGKKVELPLQDIHSEEVEVIANEFGNYLGKALIHIIHLMNPDQIIIDSPYNASQAFTNACMERVRLSALQIPLMMTNIQFQKKTYDQVTGAALSVFLDFEHNKLSFHT